MPCWVGGEHVLSGGSLSRQIQEDQGALLWIPLSPGWSRHLVARHKPHLQVQMFSSWFGEVHK